ncbi:hypothetical protein L21SP2_1384 [Salinispira pacifica]|uniref:Uncharacterized protein n=1 Tax=Salinispira pacifica TaxID=1307761 RepID=V5WG61_9SPIO|nr:hypothetical protein L21SP2_1384 [Salinispira pacifica]
MGSGYVHNTGEHIRKILFVDTFLIIRYYYFKVQGGLFGPGLR